MVFYGAIAARDLAVWRTEWAEPAEAIGQRMEKSLIDEIYSLSVRVETKHNHTLRARSLFSAAIACLIVALLFLVRGLGPTAAPGIAVPWSARFTIVQGVIFFALTALSAFDQFSRNNDRQALRPGRPVASNAPPVSSMGRYARMHNTLSTPTMRVVLPSLASALSVLTIRFDAGPMMLLGILVVLLWIVSLAGMPDDLLWIGRILIVVAGMVLLSLALPFFLRPIDDIWRLAVGFFPVFALEGWRFWSPELRRLTILRPSP